MAAQKVNRLADRVIQARVTEELKQRFDTVIAAKGYNKSAILRQLLEDWIAKEEATTRGRKAPIK